MKNAVSFCGIVRRQRGSWLRCFLRAALLLLLVAGFCSVTAAFAETCPTPPEFAVKKLQGEVHGPSGISLPQILVRLSREGIFAAQTTTDTKGKFEFKIEPGRYDIELIFMATKSMDLKVRIGQGHGFHSARLRILLGLSGTKCGFATTSRKEFKQSIKRFEGQLEEKQH